MTARDCFLPCQGTASLRKAEAFFTSEPPNRLASLLNTSVSVSYTHLPSINLPRPSRHTKKGTLSFNDHATPAVCIAWGSSFAGVVNKPSCPAKAENELYGEPAPSGGLRGNICQIFCLADARKSINRFACFTFSGPFGPGRDVGCKRIPACLAGSFRLLSVH